MKRAIIFAVVALSAGPSTVLAQTDLPPSDGPPAIQAVLKAEADRIAVIDKAKDSVLAVFATSGRGGGSGVVISADGYALTNFHVVKPCGNAMKCGMADGEAYDAVLVGVDPTGDVALIKLFGRDDFRHVELGDSDQLQPGDWCFAMGNPFLLATDFQPTVTYGIISGVHRYQYPAGTLLEYADCIQTDASINPGNSGGPLFDAQGRLVGINGRGSFEKRGRVNVGVAYAVSINQIKNFLGYLHSGRIVDHATLGAQVASDDEGRVVVTNILEQSDAYRRGLRYDDEIVSFGGRPISTPNGFKNALGIYPKGWQIPMSFRRDGERYDVLVRLRGVHRKGELLKKTRGRPRGIPMPIPKPGDKDKGDKDKGDKDKGDKEKDNKDGKDKPQPGEKSKVEKVKIKPGEKPEVKKPRPTEKQNSKEKPEPEKPEPDEQPGPDEKPKAEKPKAEKPEPSEKPKPHDKPKPDERPKSEEKPKAKKAPPDEKPKPQPRRIPIPGPGDPRRIRMIHPKAPMPEVVKKHFEAKEGYANYYFNKLHRQRVWEAWSSRADFADLGGTWTISGESTGGKKFRLQLSDAEGLLKLPSREVKWTAAADLGSSLLPRGSGGLLPALNLWRRLAIVGPARFGDVFYLGTLPLAGHDGLVDALVGVHKSVECRFMFDPAEGHLLAMEFFPDENVDPCEIRFSEYRELDGRFLPARMEVRIGDDPYATFMLNQFKFEKTAEEAAKQ